ncbi:MAG: acyl-CoA dehydrogenase family protein [Meiothermus sp.]|uniref:acyl-CoA dehydrogenase family protein n=1 Tax=Meiothermus sp. TaxID=1955249 RepID=UPI0025F98DE3|nr:acyl-CoA dehydrogenase family protein [Meiothermus sp.]MCS7059339.1 acyl-CoA dehydrogenase family protein [Meiothermus sp.]MCS7194331.1 acyl-CoA dehydrogenase family protein [Meiothermus sp.]MCX7740756.1 acyl-CoA dehydrogenase family protein [Meiothermus sp.]MDW8090508.1 acyl-CoA dehydrogenase family protein [Meiothermus sp.]MDW8482159.1 acyl-CoA dehydrogenase family protein [Meiothermus sp.]
MVADRKLYSKGGGWLLESPEKVFTPEDFDETTRMIQETVRQFVEKEYRPLAEAMEHGALEHNISLLRKCGELGLLGVEVGEEYGGLDLPKTVSTVIAEALAGTGGFSVTYGVQTSIGLLPLVYWGTKEQKDKYLAKLVSGELIAAYCLTEPQSGSDAMGAKTRAELSEDGRYYILNGTKMWISNAGFAHLFTVFAKTKEGLTAFLVERDTPGLRFGGEEKKMGIKASSTRQIFLEDVKVPVENVLGELGKGHKIAFNVLNVGRYKLGAGAIGGAKGALALSAKYAKERVAFGQPIANFGLIQQKLAEMATRIFAGESAVYRTMGLIDEALSGLDKANAAEAVLKGIEEYAVEASIIKVLGSEVLDYVVDEGVQIHGGYGYSAEYEIERAYRDSRINRIFEGTNEINRLLIPGMLLRRAMKGELPLFEAAMKLQKELLEPSFEEPEDKEMAALQGLKKLALAVLGLAALRFGPKVEEEQEVLAVAADILIDVYAAESTLLRARRLADSVYTQMAQLYLHQALDRAQVASLSILPRLAEGDDMRLMASAARRLTKHELLDLVALRRRIAARVLEAEGYPQPKA